jgi:4-hydroxyphenylpyruvate dioxygenase-like putative hemolysin
MRTEDIIETVTRMKNRGCEFLDKIPDSYYEGLRKGLEEAGTKVAEDIDTI